MLKLMNLLRGKWVQDEQCGKRFRSGSHSGAFSDGHLIVGSQWGYLAKGRPAKELLLGEPRRPKIR